MRERYDGGFCAVPFGVAGEDPSDIEGAPSPIASPLRSRRDRAPSPASYGFLPPLPSRSPAFCLVKVTQGSKDSPETLNKYTATHPTHLVNSRDTVRTDLVNRTIEAEAERKRDGKTVGKAVKLGFAGGTPYRVGNVGNRLERLGVFLHGGCDLFIGVHDRRVIATPESGSDLGK